MEITESGTRDYIGVTTEQIVKDMLTESTGRALCDSGDYYGRHWQRNQGHDFKAEPAVSVSFSAWRRQGEDGPGELECMGTVSLYHWMVNHLEFDADLQRELDEFAVLNEDMGWLELQEEFAAHLYAGNRLSEEPNTVNTYNDPDSIDLSQVLQYVKLEMEDGEFLIVSVHGGADVRGGYSAPKVFRLSDEYYSVLNAARVAGYNAGDLYWEYGYGGELNHEAEGSPVGDVLSLPAYEIGWLEGHPVLDAAVEFRQRLQRDLGLLDTVKFESSGFVQAAKAHIAGALAQLSTDELGAATEAVLDLHPDGAVIVDNHKAYLCFTNHGEVSLLEIEGHAQIG